MFERCLYFNANALARKLNARWDRAFSKFDLAPSHGYLLRLVLEKPGLSQQAIAEELRLEKSTITRFLNVLESKNLVERRTGEENLRENAIYPTHNAVGIHRDLEALGNELYAEMTMAIGQKNIAGFVAKIRDITEKI